MAIKLEKTGDTHRINLEKSPRAITEEIIINLDWSKGGFFKQLFGGAIDLDLGCFYELRDGTKMVIDGLQFSHGRGGAKDKVTRQGCYTQKPYIWHQGDDRGGGASSGETIMINPKGIETNAVVKVKVPGQEEVVVEMGQQFSSNKFCAIAQLDFGGDNSITVKKLVTFHGGHADCDRHYGWGFNWSPGTKD